MIQSRGEVNSTHFWCGAVLIKLRMQVQHSSQNISCEILLGMVINTENILVEGIWEGLSFFIFYFLFLVILCFHCLHATISILSPPRS